MPDSGGGYGDDEARGGGATRRMVEEADWQGRWRRRKVGRRHDVEVATGRGLRGR